MDLALGAWGRYPISMDKRSFITLLLILGSQSSSAAVAGLKPDHVFVADAKKSKSYIGDGVIVGGDWAIDQVVVSGIRRAANPGYERVVIDLEANRGGESAVMDRPPYYHVAVSGQSKRVVVTVMGKTKLSFDIKKVAAAFEKSILVEKVELLPLIEKDRWAFALNLKQAGSVEVFELSKPTRIILDLQSKERLKKTQLVKTTEEN